MNTYKTEEEVTYQGSNAMLTEAELKLKRQLEYFVKSGDNELLNHPKCVSSEVKEVPLRFIRQAITCLEPVVMFTKGGSSIVALQKPKPKP